MPSERILLVPKIGNGHWNNPIRPNLDGLSGVEHYECLDEDDEQAVVVTRGAVITGTLSDPASKEYWRASRGDPPRTVQNEIEEKRLELRARQNDRRSRGDQPRPPRARQPSRTN